MRDGRSWRTIGCTALVSAAVAFPLGWTLSNRAEPSIEAQQQAERPARRPATAKPGEQRNMYTATPLSDPVVVQQHLRVVETMERGCQLMGEGCAEAEQARRDIDRRLAGN